MVIVDQSTTIIVLSYNIIITMHYSFSKHTTSIIDSTAIKKKAGLNVRVH